MKKQGDQFGYNLGEIVGWKGHGKQITVRLGSAGWGYRGYADINVDSGLIESLYSLNMLGYHSNEIEQ